MAAAAALTPLLGRLRGRRVVLASASPRRRDILGYTGLQFEVQPSSFPESLDPAAFAAPQDYAVQTALEKALDVRNSGTPDVIIAADTIVVIDGFILGKPRDREDAIRMLRRLSGRQHSVFTGVAVLLHPRASCPRPGPRPRLCGVDLDPEVLTFWEETRVTFSELSEALVREYVDSGEPMDKAGAYGIQGAGAMLVERVEGDALNAAGFPLNRFCRELAAILPEVTPTEVANAVTPVEAVTPAVTSDPEVYHDKDDLASSSPSHPAPPAAEVGEAPAGPGPAPTVTGWFVTPTGFPAGLLEIINGFKDSQILFAACRLGLFDLLSDLEPRGVSEVAARVGGAAPGWVRSLMEACVGLGLLQRTERGFLNAPAAHRHLRREAALPLGRYVRCMDQEAWQEVTRLGQEVTTEPPRSPQALAWHDAAVLELEALMAAEVLATFDLSQYGAIAHVGAGTLALQLARATPRARLTPVGDPARDPLPPADLYVITALPAAWMDGDVTSLLRRVARAVGAGGAVLLAEGPTHRQPLSILGSTLDPPTPTPGGHGGRWGDPRSLAWLRSLGFEALRVTSPGRLPPTVLASRGDP